MNDRSTSLRYLMAAAALVIVIAGLRAAKSLLVPFLLATFLAVILTPALHWLQKKRVPTALAVLIMIAAVALLGAGVVALVGKSYSNFSNKRLEYEQSLDRRTSGVQNWLRERGFVQPKTDSQSSTLSKIGTQESDRSWAPLTDETAPSKLELPINPESAWRLVATMLSVIGSLFSNAGVILITTVFLLLEASQFPAKLNAAVGSSTPSLQHVEVILGNIRQYMGIKTATSAVTGVLVAALLFLLGVDYPVLWGLLAFLLNFVPNIGSIMAAIPPVLLAFLQPESGMATAMYTALGFVAINCFISYAIEPRFMGQGLGLSTLVVFVSLVFWGWVLGPVGMLLSAPLTMTFKIVLSDFDDTRWIAVLMGSKAPREAAE